MKGRQPAAPAAAPATPRSSPPRRSRVAPPPAALESPRNPFLQEVRRASLQGVATPEGLIAAEGPHLLSEALTGHWTLDRIIVTAAARSTFAQILERANAAIIECSDRAFEAVSTTAHSQGVLALLRPRKWTWSDLLGGPSPGAAPLVVLLDSLQDPGNAGALVRSAEAFRASGVVFLTGSVQAANGKLLRAAAGSLFRVPYLSQISREDALTNLAAAGCTVYGLASASPASATKCLSDAGLHQPSALVVGNEGAGLSPEIARAAQLLSIPTHAVDSLNAAVAGSIAMFEASRQRSRREVANGPV